MWGLGNGCVFLLLFLNCWKDSDIFLKKHAVFACFSFKQFTSSNKEPDLTLLKFNRLEMNSICKQRMYASSYVSITRCRRKTRRLSGCGLGKSSSHEGPVPARACIKACPSSHSHKLKGLYLNRRLEPCRPFNKQAEHHCFIHFKFSALGINKVSLIKKYWSYRFSS